MDPLIVLFGFGVGILIGMTGIGGGSLMTPLLILFIGIKPVVAIGTDIAYGAVTKTLGGWRHLRHGGVDLGVSRWLAFGSVPGSLLGVWIVARLHDRYGTGFDDVLLYVVGGVLVVVSIITLTRALFMPKLVERERQQVEMTPRRRATALVFGAVMGLILGATSVGAGALLGLVLIFVFRLTPRRVVGTDVFHAAILLWAAGLAHWVGGNVDFTLMGNILIGSLPGVWLGTALSHRVPAAVLRPALGCVMLASAFGILSKAGLAIHPAILVGVPAAIGLLGVAVQRARRRAAAPTTLVTTDS